MDKLLYNTLLFDFYGGLLTEKQREVYQMYFCEDLSLGEIGAGLGISRQAVSLSLKHSRRSFLDYESALGLVQQHVCAKEHVNALQKALEHRDYAESSKILASLGNLL